MKIRSLLFFLAFTFIPVELFGKPDMALVFDVGGLGDKSFNDSAYEGFLEVQEKLKGKFGKLEYFSPKDSDTAGEAAKLRDALLQNVAEQGYDLIFLIGFLYSDAVERLHKKFPKVNFVIIDGFVPNLKKDSNVTCVNFQEDQGSFLAGYAAARVAKKRIGFLGGMVSDVIARFEVGYKAGANYANQVYGTQVETDVAYIGKSHTAFNDAKRAAEIASKMFQNKAEIIYHASGASGLGLFEAAAKEGGLAIGVDTDQAQVLAMEPEKKDQSKVIITSMIKRLAKPIFFLAEKYDPNKRMGGYESFGLKFGVVDIAINRFSSPQVRKLRDEIIDLRKKVILGKIKVPSTHSEYEKFLKNQPVGH